MPPNIWLYMVECLLFRVLNFLLISLWQLMDMVLSGKFQQRAVVFCSNRDYMDADYWSALIYIDQWSYGTLSSNKPIYNLVLKCNSPIYCRYTVMKQLHYEKSAISTINPQVSYLNLHFPVVFPMLFLWFSPFSYGFPMGFHHFPMVFLWFSPFPHGLSYGFPMGFPLISPGEIAPPGACGACGSGQAPQSTEFWEIPK